MRQSGCGRAQVRDPRFVSIHFVGGVDLRLPQDSCLGHTVKSNTAEENRDAASRFFPVDHQFLLDPVHKNVRGLILDACAAHILNSFCAN